jgi:hypothetical protein
MLPSRVLFSESESSRHARSSADFTTTTSGFRFPVHTGLGASQTGELPCPLTLRLRAPLFNFTTTSRWVASDALAGVDAALECASVRTTSGSSVLRAMELADYLRDQALMYRKLAEQADDPVVKNEMLELASVCEEVANNIEDHLTGG